MYLCTAAGSLAFKTKIEIPADLGRTMFGVLDETGLLQPGQVFIQYSHNLKKPGKNIFIVTGWLLQGITISLISSY